MTNLDRLLNTTSAGMIAQKLDAKDGEKNGKIEASIWKEFIQEIGTGNANVDEFITVEDAMKSITKYVIGAAKKAGKNVETLANEWLNKVGGSAAADGTGEADETGEADKAGATDGAGEADKAGDTSAANGDKVDKSGGTEGGNKPLTPAQTDYNSVKVSVPVRYSSNQVKNILKNIGEGKKLAASLKKGNIKGITKDNVAYALNSDTTISFGPNSQKQADVVLKLLRIKMTELRLWKQGEKAWVPIAFQQLPPKKQNGIIQNYKSRIIAAENQIVKNDNKEKDYQNKNRSKIQKTFDGANKLLADVANMKKKPEIKSGKDEDDTEWKKATLTNGQYIQVYYDKDGNINMISISHDTTPDHGASSTFDGAEVTYTKTEAFYDNDKSNSDWEGSITSGYNFEKLKALAKKIFG